MKKCVILLLLFQYSCWSMDQDKLAVRRVNETENANFVKKNNEILLKHGMKVDLYQLDNTNKKPIDPFAKRGYLEDVPSLTIKDDGSILALVCDGNCGKEAADYCCNNFPDKFFKYLAQGKTVENLAKLVVKEIEDELFATYKKVNSSCVDSAGSTFTGVYISPNKECFFINTGDSRGLKITNGKLDYSTLDHKPMKDSEKERIEKAAQSIDIDHPIEISSRGTARVAGVTSSRLLGTFFTKNLHKNGFKDFTVEGDGLVIAEPEISGPIKLLDDWKIVLVSDGVTDKMNNEEIISYDSAQKVVEGAANKESGDDITALILQGISNGNEKLTIEKLENLDIKTNSQIKQTGIEEKSKIKKDENRFISVITNRWFIGVVGVVVIAAICFKFFSKY